MILDNEKQREILLNALRNVPIQGDFEGIKSMIPVFGDVIEAVEKAAVQFGNDKKELKETG